MSDEPHWRRLSDLFDGALEQAPASRGAWLAAHCADPALREDVRRMLAAHELSGVLDRPVIQEVPLRAQLERGLAGRYTIEREIGRGGMATVYLARELKHARLVVLKVLKPEIAHAYGAHRFHREVQVAARLSHPHVLAFIDSGEIREPGTGNGEQDSGIGAARSLFPVPRSLLYYVMPYVGGETLRERLRREGTIEPKVALVLLRDLADALAYAHGQGVVHRDIKPENVLCVGGHAYLIDFGIARLPGGIAEGENLTAEGAAIGTAGYMAPEQAAGGEAGFAADVYAWGVVAREMLTGAGPGQLAPEAGTLPEAVPPACAGMLRDSLATDPARRPASATLLATMNEAIDPPARPARRGSGALLGIAAALGAATLIATWAASRERVAPAPAPIDGALAAPVAVAALANETGDSALGTVGRLAGDWITQGLQETGLLTVVPWPYALQASAGTSGGDAVRAMQRETGAGTVVTGAYYLIGDRLRFQVEITDAATGTLIGAPPPIEAPRDSLSAAILMLRARVMGALAVRVNERVAPVPGLIERPPTFAAYRAFDRGIERHLLQDYRGAAAEFHESFALDTTFAAPLIYAAQAHLNSDEYVRADSALGEVRRRRMALSEYHELLLQYFTAHLDGDAARAMVAIRRAAEVAPGSRAGYNLALTALRLNRPREALASLEALDPDRGAIRGWPSYWTQLSHAHHLLGAHGLERTAAREMARRHPQLRVPLALEVRALAAVGDTAAMDSLLDRAAGLPPDTYWSQGAAMIIGAQELAAHGFPERGTRYLEHAVSWLANHLGREPGHEQHRFWMGTALYDLRRWRDAQPYAESLVADFPDDFDYRVLAVTLDARLGAARPERRIGTVAPHERNRPVILRARLAAIAGDTAAAVALMSEALATGIDGYAWLHGSAHTDLAILRDYPAWRRLIEGGEAPTRLE